MWESERHEEDVPINSRVVWDKGEYYVFVTTDTEKTARKSFRPMG
jgi:hypothetical protein